MAYTTTDVFYTLIFLLFQNVENINGLDPLIETHVGLIKGLEATDGNYAMFLGIPYAKVDLDNPFGPADVYPMFTETFEAYDDSAKCPQFDDSNNIGIGSLNCLHLNIYVPNSANSKNLLPIMVFIHGGSLATGFAGKDAYGPKFLVRHDIILVTINYRVGIYGFMCLGTPEVPGNQGFKDQLMALRWINKNIDKFGGDPDRVTIFGQSAGARSVDFHLMANDENLFNKAILQSGNSVSSPSITNVNTDLPITLAENLGFETNNFKEAISFFKTVEPHILVRTAYIIVGPMFQACVENEINGVEGYVSDFTINRKISKVRTTPILTGFNNNERYIFHVSKDNTYYNGLNFFDNFLNIYFTFSENEMNNVVNLIKKFYIGDEEISADVKQELADFVSDFTYIHPIQRGIAQYLSNGASKIFYYMFSYAGERNSLIGLGNRTTSGAVHSDEMGYIFDQNRLDKIPSPADQLMIDKMTTMWTNFAKYGDPTPETSDLLPVKWEPISASNWTYYNIDSEISLKQRPLNRRMAFLDLVFKMYQHLQKGLKEL